VTYNILADLYASRESAQYIMFAHCDPRFLEKQRHFPMIMAELFVYDTDIICLQEVDGSIYDTLLHELNNLIILRMISLISFSLSLYRGMFC